MCGLIILKSNDCADKKVNGVTDWIRQFVQVGEYGRPHITFLC